MIQRMIRPVILAIIVAAGTMLSACVDASRAIVEAEAATATFHQEFNAARFRDIHRRADPHYRQTVTEDQFTQVLTGYRSELGDIQPGGRRRDFVMSRTPRGALVALTYRSKFAKGSAQEEFVWRLQGGEAKLHRYAVTSVKIAAPRPVAQARPTTLAVRLVPTHASPEHLLYLQGYYEERLGLRIEIEPALVPDPAAWTAEREQWSAEGLAEQLRQAVDAHGAVVIGITDHDVYLRGLRWPFAFAWRPDDRVAVISYARMDPQFFRGAADEELLRARLRRMVGKELGIMLYGLPVSEDPASPMFRDIRELNDLDEMEDDLASAGFPVRKAR